MQMTVSLVFFFLLVLFEYFPLECHMVSKNRAPCLKLLKHKKSILLWGLWIAKHQHLSSDRKKILLLHPIVS